MINLFNIQKVKKNKRFLISLLNDLRKKIKKNEKIKAIAKKNSNYYI